MTSIYKNFFNAQSLPHDKLIATVTKHAKNEYKKPISIKQQSAFANICLLVQESNKKLILDFFCGTGMSSYYLALTHNDCLVIGIDISVSRLKKFSLPKLSNLNLIRACAYDQISLMAKNNFKIEKAYLLYPNPYPKSTDLKKRFYAHPTFPKLISICKSLELRTNWKVFAKEFYMSAQTLGKTCKIEPYHPKNAISLFEKKYTETNCPIFKVNAS